MFVIEENLSVQFSWSCRASEHQVPIDLTVALANNVLPATEVVCRWQFRGGHQVVAGTLCEGWSWEGQTWSPGCGRWGFCWEATSWCHIIAQGGQQSCKLVAWCIRCCNATMVGSSGLSWHLQPAHIFCWSACGGWHVGNFWAEVYERCVTR